MNDTSLASLYNLEVQQPNTSLITGKHTQLLYERLSRKEAGIFAQLRTGMARLNVFLHRIGVALSDQYACGQATETVYHFLFRCRRWTAYRTEMLKCTDSYRSNISFYLGWNRHRVTMTRLLI